MKAFTLDSSLNCGHRYRADIDGLRAVAILMVVLFHIFPGRMRGGYIGVDVFFVISGYLISGILLDEIANGRFNIGNFYLRRIKRIFPALVVVLAACAWFGYFALLPDEYRRLGKHIGGSAAFVSNFVLWNEVGYFDSAAETKPLLHLWSLGIEEQFYIFWPVVLWAAWKSRSKLMAVVACLALASMAMNLRETGVDRAAAFYSPLTRFWELLLGAGLAALERPERAFLRRFVTRNGTLFSLCGGALIVAGAVLITGKRDFPGLWALLPTLGAASIIAAGPEGWLNRKLLASRPLVALGLLSFSLYLWHWPILSFAKIVLGDLASIKLRLSILAASMAMAWLSFRFVETPVRKSRHPLAVAASLVAAMTVIGLFGSYAQQEGSAVARMAEQHGRNRNLGQLVWHDVANEACRRKVGQDFEFCMLYGDPDKLTFAILGDSTANHLAPGLGSSIAAREGGLINLGGGGCPPIRGLIANEHWGTAASPFGRNCMKYVEAEYEFIKRSPSIKTVLLAFFPHDFVHWGIPGSARTDEERFAAVGRLFSREIRELRALGKDVIVTYDSPYLSVDIRHCLPRPLWPAAGECIHPESLFVKEPYQGMFDRYFAAQEGVRVFRQADVFAAGAGRRLFDTGGIVLMRDDHHLSYRGSELAAAKFMETYRRTAGGIASPNS